MTDQHQPASRLDEAAGGALGESNTDSSKKSSVLIVAGIIALVLLAGVAAVLIGSGDDEAATVNGDPLRATAPVVIDGKILDRLERAGSDAMIGRDAPDITGVSFDGTPIAITDDGRPKLIAFIAHWCPHCQEEVPLVQSWIDTNGLPDGVDLYAVSTAVDPRRPNHPPAKWLRNEGWSIPTMADSDQSEAAEAFGLAGFPYWVAIDDDGNIFARLTGGQSTDTLEALIDALS